MTEIFPQEVKPDSFVFEIKNALSTELCLAMVDRFEEKKEQQQAKVEDTIKKTVDIPVSGNLDWVDNKALFASLGKIIRAFREQFPFFTGPFKDTGYHIQRYLPGEYYQWHIDGGSHNFSYRQLVALWYLNDVPGPGSETEFLHQKIKVKPEQGKPVLFPPFWTHEHQSVELKQGVKYIATTWLSFA